MVINIKICKINKVDCCECKPVCDGWFIKNETKKVHINSYNVAFCPRCNGSVWQVKHESNYCFRCGQELNWD